MELIDITPIMTSNTTPTPYFVSASNEYSVSNLVYKVFDNDKSTDWMGRIISWLKIDFGQETQIDAFSISGVNDTTASPRSFKLYGSNDDINFFELFSVDGESMWGMNETRHFTLNTSYHYRYYRINVLANNGHTIVSGIKQIRLYKNMGIKISHSNASLKQTLPMNTTKNILVKRDDAREGLLGMSNDQENYGDLYVVGKDGRSHLIKSAIKSEIIFEGYASGYSPYNLSKSIYEFKQLLVTASGNNNEFFTMMINTNTIKIKETYQFLFNFSTGGNDRQIIFNFPSVTSFKIPYRTLGGYSNIGINQIVGIY